MPTLSPAATRKLLKRSAPLVSVIAFAVSLWALQGWMRDHRYADVTAALAALPSAAIAAAIALTALDYAVATGYDFLAMRDLGRRLPPGLVAATAFTANVLGNSFGNTLITGSAVRAWSYTTAGLSGMEIARLVGVCSISFWLGFLAAGVVALPASDVAWPAQLAWAPRPFAAGCVLLLVAYAALVFAGRMRGPLGWGKVKLRMPSPAVAAGQVAIGALDILLLSAAFRALLPPDSVTLADAACVMLVGVFAGNASFVPAGLGVFESVVVLMLSPRVPVSTLAAALVAWRAIYFLLPLLAAVILLVLRAGTGAVPVISVAWGRRLAPSLHALRGVAPDLLAAAVFTAGALLLLRGSLPAQAGRLDALAVLVPLPVIEASHFLASLAGAALLVLAHALQRRLDGAWRLCVGLLAASVVLSLGRGWDNEQALGLAALALVLLAARRQFTRRSSLLAEPFSARWTAAGGIVLLGTLWLVQFARQLPSAMDLPWWAFALHAEAARSERAAAGAAVVLSLAALHWLLRGARPALAPPSPQALETAAAIARRSPATSAFLVLRGDKSLLFDRAGRSFLMVGRAGRSWVAMGDPVGTPEGQRELLWRFRDLCDRHDGWCVFFEVHDTHRAAYAEIGLVLTPIGEQARVDLQGFHLESPALRDLRHARARLMREGCRFEIVPPEGVPALVPELARVSASWLATKPTREKGFSTASFDPAYLARFPVAVVRGGDRVLAFANIWEGAGKEELSIDLMRHAPDAPNGTMDFLFAELLAWGRDAGYRWFDFGMAPLAGLASREDAPVWGRFATLLYRHGEHFYSFEGLRRYKAKFQPCWTPLYLASPGGVALPAILLDVTALIAGGVRGIVAR